MKKPTLNQSKSKDKILSNNEQSQKSFEKTPSPDRKSSLKKPNSSLNYSKDQIAKKVEDIFENAQEIKKVELKRDESDLLL